MAGLGGATIGGPSAPTYVSVGKRLGGLSILVVDDIADARQLLATLLRMAGARAFSVAGSAEALKAVAHFRFAAIVSDIGMPGMDGFDLIRSIRSLPAERGGQVPAVAVTGFAHLADRRRCLQAGFQELLVKPVDHQELIDTLLHLTGH